MNKTSSKQIKEKHVKPHASRPLARGANARARATIVEVIAPAAPAAVTEATPGSAVERAYRHIESLIVTMALQPGAMLSEVELGRQLGLSRTPVGEALQRLAREGLVNILPKRGIVVTQLDVANEVRLLELRREIARFAARVGALRANPEQREQLRGVAAALMASAANHDEAGLLEADKAFHTLFAESTQNDYVVMNMDSMDALSRRFWFAHKDRAGDMQRSARLHADIALAIADGKAMVAQKASDALADYLDEFTRATLDMRT